jgi:biotin transport system ATP-binding protein
MISIENVCKSFKTSQGIIHALKNISLEISDNSCTVIAGENGSGKSVLMYIIAGLEKADSGELKVDGRVGLVFQEAETQILGETPREDITFGPKNLGWKKDKIELAVKNALEQTGLTNKADFPARFLSGGEKRRLAVACMLAMDLPIIIFDEPYANLDYSGVKQVNELIRQLKKNGKTIIILTHEIEKCLALADKFVVLFRGEIKFDGTPQEGLKHNLEKWNIRNPLVAYSRIEELVW